MDGYFYYGRKTSRSKLPPACDGYYGTPITNKEKWLTTMYWKTEIKEYETFEEMAEAEIKLIRPHLNFKMCLNEGCGGLLSLEKITQIGKDNVRLNRGWFAISTEERKQIGSRSGLKNLREGKGIFSLTPEEKHKIGIENGQRCKETKTGVCGLSQERRKEIGNLTKELGIGIHALSKEERQNNARKSSSQKWVNTHPDYDPYVSTAAGLSHWQRARGIPTSFREKLKV